MNEWGPFCCEESSRWVNNGPTLQYYYCDVCKKEVEPVQNTINDGGSHGRWPTSKDAYASGFNISQDKLKWAGPPIQGRKAQQRALDEEAAKLRVYLSTTTELVDPPSRYYPHKAMWIVNKTDSSYFPVGTILTWPAGSSLPTGWEGWYA
jgi:hypothetical protein